MTSRPYLTGAALLFSLAAITDPLVAQTAPTDGRIGIVFVTPANTPAAGATFNVQMHVDLTEATGTCAYGGGFVPFTWGAGSIGIAFDTEGLEFVSGSLCAQSPPELTTYCVPNVVGGNCVIGNLGNTDEPSGGRFCLADLTLRSKRGTPVGSFTAITVPDPRGISSNHVLYPANCGGPTNFTGTIVQETVRQVPRRTREIR